MKQVIKNYAQLLAVVLAVTIAFGMTGCNNQKKLAKQEYEAKVTKAKDDLNSIINDRSTLSLDEKENLVENIRNMQLDDPEVAELLEQAETKLADERSALIQQELEAKKKQEAKEMEAKKTTFTIHDYFESISKASSSSEANMFINEALKLFTAPDAPVLIIISKTIDGVDYDRPTTILNYLNYLKDTGNNINTIENIKYDGSGKISELELMKHL